MKREEKRFKRTHNPVLVIIPTFNEAHNIEKLLPAVLRFLPDADILVIDDASPDGTFRRVEKMTSADSRVNLLMRPMRLGLGSALKEGYEYAVAKGYDVIVQMDADFSHQPFILPKMLSAIRDSDLVIGSRYVKGGGVSQWPASRIVLSRAANLFCRFLLGVPVDDITSGFKCMRRSVLSAVEFDSILSRGYAFQVEMVYRSHRAGQRIKEYPIVFKGRAHEHSKMSFGIVIEAVLRVLILGIEKIWKRR